VRTSILLCVVASLAACSSLTPVDDPVYLRIQDLEARLIRIERVLNNDSLISLASDVTSLRNEVQSLDGDIETLRHDLDEQSERQRDLYVDLDRRLADLEAAEAQAARTPGVAGPGSGAGFGGAAAGVSDQDAYGAAFGLIQQQDFAGAQSAFQNFLANYPQSSLRANAQYWLGETYYGQLSFMAALGEFKKVVDNYPDSSKLPDALLKMGYCYDELGDLDAARQALLRVVREFPDTQAAGLADQRLDRISEERG
jgi:tol-pal system protein YbgF